MAAPEKGGRGLPPVCLSSSPSRPSPWTPAQRGLGAVSPTPWEAGEPWGWVSCLLEDRASVLGGVHSLAVAQGHFSPQLRSPPWSWLFDSLFGVLSSVLTEGCRRRVGPPPPCPPSPGEARPFARSLSFPPRPASGTRARGLRPGLRERGPQASALGARPARLPALRAAPGSG